jgi:hypothetical protein
MPPPSYHGRPEPSPWEFDYDSVDYWSNPNYTPPYPDTVNDYWSDASYSPPRERIDALHRQHIMEAWEEALGELKARRAAAVPPPEVQPQAPPPDVDPAPPERPKPTPKSRRAPAWLEAVAPCFDGKPPYPSLGSLRDAVKSELTNRRRKKPEDRTIERMLVKHSPDWFTKQET